MSLSSRFVYVMDRYLEVSNVYHQRLLHGAGADDSTVPDRAAHLLKLVESVDVGLSDETTLHEVKSEDVKGQLVVPTQEFLEDTADKQAYVLQRLGAGNLQVTPHNQAKLRNVLGLPPDEFLASFPAFGYAWDILTELVSLSVLPDAEGLAARDMIHMHSVELKSHLVRLVARHRLSSLGRQIELRGSLAVEDLEDLQDEGELVETLAEFAIPRDPVALLEMVDPLIADPERIATMLKMSREEVLGRLRQEALAFPDSLNEQPSLDRAREVCDMLVIFGLLAGYAAWCSVAFESSEERRSLRKSMLFCTRILLDVGRWKVCVSVAEAVLAIYDRLAEKCEDDPDRRGTSMIKANLFFARRKTGQAVEEKVRAWDTSGLHLRYTFLKRVLLDDFAEASDILPDLLRVEKNTGKPSLCIQEINEWPILAAFRESTEGRVAIEQHAKTLG